MKDGWDGISDAEKYVFDEFNEAVTTKSKGIIVTIITHQITKRETQRTSPSPGFNFFINGHSPQKHGYISFE